MKLVKREDGWIEAWEGDRLLIKFLLPPHTTMLELHAFTEHLLKLIKEREHGPS